MSAINQTAEMAECTLIHERTPLRVYPMPAPERRWCARHGQLRGTIELSWGPWMADALSLCPTCARDIAAELIAAAEKQERER